MTPVNFFNRSLISYALGERQSSLWNLCWRFRANKSQSRKYRDNYRTCGCTDEDSARIEQTGLSSAFRFHDKVMAAVLELDAASALAPVSESVMVWVSK